MKFINFASLDPNTSNRVCAVYTDMGITIGVTESGRPTGGMILALDVAKKFAADLAVVIDDAEKAKGATS